MPSTVTSLSELHTHLDPSSPPEYLQHVIVSTLHRKGFHAAEAGALAEMERLLERHVRGLFSKSRDWAQLSGRAQPNAMDVAMVQQSKMKAKRRKAIPLERTEPTPEPTMAETLGELHEEMRRLDHAYPGAPSLPIKWTYAGETVDASDNPSFKVTTASLDFVKSTVAEAGIDPELGIVHYRRK